MAVRQMKVKWVHCLETFPVLQDWNIGDWVGAFLFGGGGWGVGTEIYANLDMLYIYGLQH